MESVNDMLGRDADGGDEEFGTAVDDDVNQLVELAFGIIVAVRRKCKLASPFCILIEFVPRKTRRK